jgi:hypothetical protein
VKIVSEIVDIEDPNMLDKIDNHHQPHSDISKSCVCSSPENKNMCNFCLTNSNKKHKNMTLNYDSASNKKTIPYTQNMGTNYYNISRFDDSTPNRCVPSFNTPGYGRYNNFINNSENKINYAK